MAPKNKLNLKDRCENGELDLSMSDLQEVPVKEIATVKKVTSLDLSNNRLTTLGKNFTSLLHITKLDLSKNLLKELPEDFGDMKQLKHLDLYSNQISHLPLSFCELKNLRWLDLKNNPLVPAVAKIVGPCLDAQQCQQSARAAVAFLSEMRVRVEEERERLRVQEVLKLEAQQDKERQVRKRNERKKAARAKKKETGKREVEVEKEVQESASSDRSEGDIPWPVETERSVRPVKRNKCCQRPSCLFYLFSLFAALAIVPFFLGEQHLREVVRIWHVFVQWLPENARPWAQNFSHWIAHVYDMLTPHVNTALEVTSQTLANAWNQTVIMYRTLSERVLVMTDEIAKKLS